MSSSGSARPLRWLVVGPFSAAPTGRITPISGERFSDVMRKVSAKVEVDVTDFIGSGSTRRIEVEFSRLRSFRAADVISQDDTLRQLDELAERLERNRGPGDPAAAVERIAGTGRLTAALRGEAPAPAPSPEPAPPAASVETDTDASERAGIDAIFAKADVAPASTATEAKSAVSSFIGAIRSASATSTTSAGERERATNAAGLIRAAVADTVAAVVDAPAFADLEVAWRSLSMIVSAAPGSDDLALDLLDASEGTLADAIGHALDRPGLDRADAVFVVPRRLRVEDLTALAAVAAQRHVPIVVEIPSEIAGLSPDGATGDVPEAWAELRTDPGARWLAAVTNAPVLYEEAAPYARHRFGGAAAALAAMAAASVGRTAAPADVLGRSGSLTGPAAHDVEIRGQTLTIPTQRFASVEAQHAAADRGVVLLGSEPGRPQLRLTACPTVGGGDGDPSLPGRIVAGRATRLARQVQAEHPTATSEELAAALAEASGRLLPNADTSAVALTVRIDGDGVTVDGSIGANLAGADFKFSSDV